MRLYKRSGFEGGMKFCGNTAAIEGVQVPFLLGCRMQV